jgi:hypothetical protein
MEQAIESDQTEFFGHLDFRIVAALNECRDPKAGERNAARPPQGGVQVQLAVEAGAHQPEP